MTTGIADEVWAELDPRAARLPRRARRLALAAIGAALVVVAGYVVLVQSGEVRPKLTATRWYVTFENLDPGQRGYTLHVTVRNYGWFDEKVVQARSGQPDVSLEYLQPRPLTIRGGASRTFTIRYRVHNCRAVPTDGNIEPTLVLERFWGTATAVLYTNSISDGQRLLPHPLADGPAAKACAVS